MPKNDRLPPDYLQKLKDAVNLVEVVGEHVVLKRSGANYTGLCPFHSERSPSFSVSEQKQLYHCYGCKKGGDLIRFVMELHGLSFPETIEELASRARIPLPKNWRGADSDDPEIAKRSAAAREKLQTAWKLNRFAAQFFHTALSNQPPILQYFQKRGVGSDLIRSFYLGAAPNQWDALSVFLAEKKAPLELAIELGLIKPSKNTAVRSQASTFDLFRNRAIFPILDLRGKVVGFGGRILPSAGSDSKDDGPKYLNSSDSFVFQKGKVAYGLFQAQKHIREADEVILVEGYFDVLALHAAGIQNAVAICGTAMTEDHLALFRRFGSKVTLLLDGDRAGQDASVRAMELALSKGIVLYGASIPEGLDPDEVLFDQETGKPVPGGVERMKQVLAKAQPILDTLIQDTIRTAIDARTPEAKAAALKTIAAALARFSDPIGREIRFDTVEKGLQISRDLLQRAISEAEATVARGNRRGAPSVAGPQAPTQGQGRNPSNPATQAPKPRVQIRAQGRSRPAASSRLSDREKVVLSALVKGLGVSDLWVEWRRKLPPELTFSDLFDYFPARDFIRSLSSQASGLEDPTFFQRIQQAPESYLGDDLDAQVRSTITEALVAPTLPFAESEIRSAMGVCGRRALERISQALRVALAEAEAKKDEGLEARLKKEYLDLQRKLKEFTAFYDQA
ncbi:MAG: DNA primase [Bdellovibrionales bacterium]|nr:DNA primase [Bdellovibrionales bacterium]